MKDKKAKKFTDKIFELIRNAESIEDLIKIEQNENLEKYRIDNEKYPKISFTLHASDLEKLIKNEILKEDFSFHSDLTAKIKDPLAKLLYALSWKNGDLIKLKHIARGISEVDNPNDNNEDALVFYQFGKYLTKTKGQPIIDQHVIRAFSVYKTTDDNEINNIRSLDGLKKKHKHRINQYTNWLSSDELKDKLKLVKDYSYYIDKILYATGKLIKYTKK